MDITLEDDSHKQLNAIFDRYIKNNKSIYDLFTKHSNENVYTLEHNGIEIHRPPNPFPTEIDFGVHTCGGRVFPDSLGESHFSKDWTNNISWTGSQLNLINSKFAEIVWDFELFDEATRKAKNCWPGWLVERAWYERVKKSQYSHNLQRGDVLNFLSDNWGRIINEIAEDSNFGEVTRIISFDHENTYGISINIFDLAVEMPEIKEKFSEEEWQQLRAAQEEDLNNLEETGIAEVLSNPLPAISARVFEVFCERNYKCNHFEQSKCRICGLKFFPQSQNRWTYLLTPTFCDACIDMTMHRQYPDFQFFQLTEKEIREFAIFGVRNFFKIFGYLPKSSQNRAKSLLKSFHNSLSESDFEIVLKSLAILPSMHIANQYFGSWTHLLAEANLLELTNRGKGGYKSIASDGHICLSLGERAICEFLHRQGVLHSKEPMYPKHRELNPNGLMRADFEVNGVFIEFAGMMGNPEYAKRMKNKEKLARVKKIKWMKLESAEIQDLERLLKFIISK